MKHLFFIYILVLSSTINIWSQQSINYYEEAFIGISNMLNGIEPLSIRRAVFLAEWAFLEGELDYEKDFYTPLKNGAEYLMRLIAANHWEKYKTAKQIALCNFFFTACSGNAYIPFTYDFSKEFPDEDWHYQLISRTLKTHRGQCHSLPWAYKLFAEELRADVYLARAPRHCFIMYPDEDNLFPEEWVNVEVTAQQYQPTWAIKEHFEISDSAIIAGTYLTPLSDEQTIACQLADLGLSYYNKYKTYDTFTLKCADLSLKYYPMNPNAIIIKMKSLEILLQNHLIYNGGFRDNFTNNIDSQLYQCQELLRTTHWTQETDALRKRWKQTPEEIENIKATIQYVK